MGNLSRKNIFIFIACIVLFFLLMFFIGKTNRNNEEKKQSEITAKENTAKVEKQKELQNAYGAGIKQIYNLTNNCQIAKITFATTTRSLIEASCAREIMLKEVKKAKNNCPVCEQCEECQPCD